MKLIDRYVYTVVRRLPESMRAEVEAELRARISDLLSGDLLSGDFLPDEGAVREALKAMGNPILLADQYRGGPRVLIGPDTFEIYLRVLKIALIVVACAVPVAVFMEGMLMKGGWQGIEALAAVLGRMLSSGVAGVIQAFAWVTVVFAVLDKTKAFHVSWPYTGKTWTADDLDDPGAGGRGKNEKIGYVGPAFSIAFTVLGVAFLWRFAALLGWYEIGDGEILVTPFFAPEILRIYLPFIAASALLQMAVSACLLITQAWTRALAGLNLLVSALSTALALVMVNDFRLISPQFIKTMAGHLDIQAAKLSEYWQWGLIGLSVLVVLAFVGEIFQSIRRLR